MKEIEKNLIINQVQKHYGNQRRVADDLKIPKSTLHDKLKFYGIDAKIFKRRSRI